MSKHDNWVISATGIIIAMLGVLASAANAIVKWEYWHMGIYGLTVLLLLISF